jgi:hypothetical protein
VFNQGWLSLFLSEDFTFVLASPRPSSTRSTWSFTLIRIFGTFQPSRSP